MYGPNCNIPCNAQNSCNSGHFQCDTNGMLVCQPNWLPPNCNTKAISTVSDPECPNSLLAGGGCQNGGTCFNNTCCCPPGITGTYCDTPINYCINNQCQNNALCVSLITSYKCVCLQGFTGQYCEQSTNPCTNTPCKNGGLCSQTANSYQCSCINGWTGSDCSSLTNYW